MTKLSHARVALSPALSALLALSGCATKTTQPQQPAAKIVTLPALTNSNEIPSAHQPIKAREPEIVPTTQIAPCVFRGSLLAGNLLYSQAAGGRAIAQLDERAAVLIDRLELPSTPGGRAKVIVRSPIQLEAYIENDAHIVEINRRVDVVSGHVWLDPGTRVHASLRPGGTAEITKKFPDGTTPPELVKLLPCALLSLPQQLHINTPKREGKPAYLQHARISIHESAGGAEIAAIPTSDDAWPFSFVWVLEEKPGWVHVEGDEVFHFKGWILASSLLPPDKGFGIIGLLSGPGDVTHQVTRPIPLRIEATDAAPVIANAATGAEIFIAPGPPGYRVIQIGGGVDAPDGTSFFAREADLMGAVQLAEGVEPGEPESADPPKENASVPSAPMPPPAPILPLSIEKNWDLAAVPVHASLEEGARRIQKGDWAGAAQSLTTAVKALPKGDFEARMIGHALLGRACDRKGDDTCAGTAYTKVLEIAKSAAAKIDAIVALGGDTGTKLEARLLLAQGEALFYKAEQTRKAADAIQYPIYRGSGDRDDVMEHIQTKVMEWIKKKRPMVEASDQAYAAILELQPAPPPAWAVLAAGRAGDIWSAFVYEFQSLAPIPSEWNGTGTVPGTDVSYEELRREYRQKLIDATEPQRKQAEAAYKSCRERAKKHGVLAAEGKRCEERLVAMGATP